MQNAIHAAPLELGRASRIGVTTNMALLTELSPSPSLKIRIRCRPWGRNRLAISRLWGGLSGAASSGFSMLSVGWWMLDVGQSVIPPSSIRLRISGFGFLRPSPSFPFPRPSAFGFRDSGGNCKSQE